MAENPAEPNPVGALCYKHPTDFSRAFKKHTGTNPRALIADR